jgi:hypothetical protein
LGSESASGRPLASLAVDDGAEGERDECGDQSEQSEGCDDVFVMQLGRVEQIMEREEVDIIQRNEVCEPSEEEED